MIRDLKIKEWFHNNADHERNMVSRILDVDYAHMKLENEDDLYITKYGMSFIEHLQPENFWTDKKWFAENSIKLSGTSSVYKVATKAINGKSKELVLKWNRMGQDVPGAEDELIDAEFNSPFEEFSLVMELKEEIRRSTDVLDEIFVQIPLAIYVPIEYEELDRIGRKEYKMQGKIQKHEEVVLNMNRLYAVIYEWIPGIDAVQALNEDMLSRKEMEVLTLDAEGKMKKRGFLVRDRKPHHIIVSPSGSGGLSKTDEDKIKYGVVDFELMERTQERKEEIRKSKRKEYHKRQKDRFNIEIPKKFHPHLSHVSILGVDYVFGVVESTKGRLWVVGKDPYLFDYFLPERWRKTDKTKISMSSERYYTISKDEIHLVWEVSKVGLRPDMDPFKEDEKKVLEHGYNSPFEEISLAVELSRRGVSTIYPRAIYMAGNKTEVSSEFFDESRYIKHEKCIVTDDLPILMKDHGYITIWGYWNGPDEKLADKDEDYYEGINALTAYREEVIDEKEYLNLVENTKKKLAGIGVEDLNLRGNHLLISFDSNKKMITDKEGNPDVRICNFEFLKKIR